MIYRIFIINLLDVVFILYIYCVNLINLAQYIYDQKVLYIHKHGGYKLMELSSIHAELAALKKSVEEEYMKEKKEKREQAEKLKSKY